MPEIKYFYLIRCDLGVVLGLDPSADPALLSYVSELHLGAVARDVGFIDVKVVKSKCLGM